jgi:ABC-type multidrug transport system ATPase subunit/ABC-type multidrug transport system permease subunit
MDEDDDNIIGGSLDEEQVIAPFPGLKPSPKTQLRTQLNEASKALAMEHEYIRRLEEALAAHGVDDLEALRSDLVPSASFPSSPFPLNDPSTRQHRPDPGSDGLTFPPPSFSSTIEAFAHIPERSASTSGAAAMLQHYRSPSQLTRPDYNEIFDTSNCTHPPKLIRSESVFAHATEVRFDDLNYTVQKQATRAGTLTVGAQCLKLWSWPFACLLRRNQQQQRVEIKVLKNLRGVLLPGRLTLLLGPPGSGKSTFLKALSGRVERTRTSVLKGRVTYNGDTAESHRFSLPKVVAFVSQEDCHAPTMTVQETVQFAYDCMNGPPPQVVAPSNLQSSIASNTELAKHLIYEQQQHAAASFSSSSSSSSSSSFPSSPSSTAASSAASTVKKTGKVEQTLRVLGLSRCQRTIVGNALLRGISGGEKKRLTTAEMTGGQVNVLLMDSISTGLDSAATFDICKTLSVCTRALQANIVVCLLQPPPEVFDLFDDVILMDGGQIVYQGPREQVLEHFECLGFRCPPRKDVADFLVEVTTPMGSGYRIPASQRYAAGIPDPPRTTDEFVRAFQQTEIYESMVDKMEAPPSFAPWLRRQRHEFSNGWFRSTWLCLQRQIKITARDRVFLRGRVMQVLLMGVMAGTLFYQLDAHDWSDKVCMLFFSLMFIALGNLATIPTVMEQRSVFYKQRDSGFFPTSAAVVAQMLVQIPIQFVETLIFTSLAYFLSGLSRAEHGSYYLTYVLVAFSTALAIGQIFRLVVHVVPSLAQAQPICALCVLLFVVFSGLTIKGEDVPIYWTWLYWINPLAWGLRALAINEFSSPTYSTHIIYPPPIPKAVPCDPKWPEDLLKHSFPGGPYHCLTEGEIYLTNLGFKTTREWIVGGILFLFALWSAMLLLTMLAMHFIRWTGRSMVPLPPAAASEVKGEDGQGEDGRKGKQLTAATGAGGDLFSYQALTDGADEAALPWSSRRHSHTMGASLSFTPVTLVFKHLWYSVELPKPQGGGKERVELVKGVSGYAKPGTMTALMGSSGAGKTTLLDVLAGRKTTGTIIGEILVNGFEKVQSTFSRVCGYVEQQDVHSPHSTVREALMFSATLRLSYAQVTEAQRVAFVEEMLELLELQEIANRVIGEDADSGLLMGERKRVTIGVELVANPSVLFLDEPTTGLDAAKALEVMRAVKKIAASGRSVICTIHQPSCVTFEMFDMLLLLRHGGRTVYFGPLGEQSVHLISYFEGVPGVTSMRPGGVNPANWMLECIGAGIEPAAQAVDFAEFYQDHALARRNEELCETLGQPSALYGQQLSPIAFETRYAAPLKVQLRACMTKAVTNYWRSPNYNVTRCLISCVVGVVFGSVYHDKAYDTETDIIGRTGLMYLSTSFVGIVNMMSVMPVMAKERAAFYREQASSMYSVLAYGISYGLVELPYIFVSTGLFVNVFYWYIGLATDPLSKFVYYWIFFALYIVCMVFIGQFLICLLPNQQTAQVAGASIAATMNLFGGYLCTPKTIPPFWKFVYYLVPSHYMLEGLVMSQFEGDKTPVKPIYGLQATPADEYIYDHFGGEFTYGAKWKDIWVLILYISLLRVGTFLVMKFVRHINR